MARKSPKATRSSKGTRVTPGVRRNLYAARQYLETETQDRLTVSIPFDVYFQDPGVTKATAAFNFDESFTVPWEPGISDGPTSARFAVIDYDGTLDRTFPPAEWDEKESVFRDPDGKVLDRKNVSSHQFHQVNVWATLQNALDFFEDGAGLGRHIDWAFDGSRLIVVPHAGYGENAFYDRESKSLQFYYFDHDGDRIHTCLSADIINHEFGHAVLDGLRPLYQQSVSVETAAFHEFVGDISAILIAFRNTKLRKQIAIVTGGDLETDGPLSKLAEQFAQKDGEAYLRSALNELTYAEVKSSSSHHYMSQALTGAMFDILRALYKRHNQKHTVLESLWYTASRMQSLAIQPLDLLPPVDVTFADYALAVLQAERIVNPTDPERLTDLLLEVFARREILSDEEIKRWKEEVAILSPVEMLVFHDAEDIASSRAAAYRFLDDNRRELLIPYAADVSVTSLSTAIKYTARRRRQAKHILIQYVWRETVELVGTRFGRFQGQTTDMICGGTLALDIDGNLLAWSRKPGTLPLKGSKSSVETRLNAKVAAESEAGAARRQAFLNAIATRLAAGAIGGPAVSGPAGILQKSMAPVTATSENGVVHFKLSPHIGVCGVDHDLDEATGERSWSISS
jgi:hypothetical protein